MKDVLEKLVIALGIIALGAIVMTAGAYPFKWAWNYVMPELFGLPRIGALQSFCLMWVMSSMFKATLTSKS